MIEISESGYQIGESDITHLESEFGTKLPDAYRRFLLLHNGGVPSPEIIDIAGASWSPTDIQVFFGIGSQIVPDNLSWNLQLIKDRRPDLHILPVACDSGGNLFCLRVSNDGSCEVIYYDMNDRVGTIYEVAPNFDAFLNKIRPWMTS